MAISCAKSVLQCFQDDTTNTAVLIKDMDMQESLTINDTSDPQLIRIGVHCIWEERKVEIDIKSIDSKGKFSRLHAKALVVFTDLQQEQQTLHQSMGKAGSLIDSLKSSVASGVTERFTTSMAYRMVASLAHYDTTHKGVKEVFLNSTSLEAAASVSSAAQDRLPGDFTLHPCVFDSILQLATFVLNANENSIFDQEVYVVRGWDCVFIDGGLSVDDEYRTFVEMVARDKDTSVGDIVILKGDSLIGCMKGVRVQRVPRRLMDVMFKRKAAASDNAVMAKIETKDMPVQQIAKATSDSSRLKKALSIISEESCIALQELKDEDLLSSIGIDSLLILVIASRFREELQLDLQPTFFAEVNSIGAIRAFFDAENSSPSDSGPGTPSSLEFSTPDRLATSSRASSVSSEPNLPLSNDKSADVKKAPVSTSVLLQGTLHANTQTIFLFPDGSGSATSYMNLPKIHDNVAVVALNCPYMTTPNEMRGTFEDIAGILLAEVRRRQPHGPYHLGGWSAGGAFAYCAAQMLIAAGEAVPSLVLIDAPCPVGLGKLPQAFFDFWRRIHQPGGMMGDRPLPPWLMDHFKAVNANLRTFTAKPLPSGRSPKTFMAWAARGTDNLAGFTGRHLLTDEENADLGFLMDDKTDFGTRGWERLLEGELTVERAMSSNHFTIVRGEGAALLAGLIRKACLGLKE